MEQTLGDRLRAARKGAGLTQRDLAHQVGVTAQAIQQLESGATKASRFLHRIAGALGIPVNWLETGDSNLPTPTSYQDSPDPFLRAVGMTGLKPDLPVPREPSGPDVQLAFFPPENLAFKPDHLPVFVSMPLTMAISRNQGFARLLDEVVDDLPKPKDPTKSTGGFAGLAFAAIISQLPDDYLPRPRYVAGQVSAYGLFQAFSLHMSPRLRNAEVLHVDPSLQPRQGDIVVIYHKSNALLTAEFFEASPENIWVDTYMEMDNIGYRFKISLEHVRAVHTVRGLEFTEPRSAKIRFGRFVAATPEGFRSGVSGLGGVDPTEWEGPDEPN